MLLAGLGLVILPSRATNPLPPSVEPFELRLAAQPTNVVLLVEAARACHNEATKGGREAPALVKRSKEHLKLALRQDPQNTFAQALLGSATILSARDAIWVGTKLRRVREGLALMDAALVANPDDHHARFTRASNNLFLPEMFDRKAVVVADFNWLQERADRGEFEGEFRQYVFLFHGRAQQRFGDATRVAGLWEAGIAVDPGSPVADELRRELAALSAVRPQ